MEGFQPLLGGNPLASVGTAGPHMRVAAPRASWDLGLPPDLRLPGGCPPPPPLYSRVYFMISIFNASAL